MATESGFNNQKKLGTAQFKTIQPLGSDKYGTSNAMMGLYNISSGITIDLAVLSNDGKVYTVKVDSHGAKVGDVLRIESGPDAPYEYVIEEIAGADFVRVLATFPPPVGETAGVYRWIPLGLDSTGNIVITPPAGGATEAKQDVQIAQIDDVSSTANSPVSSKAVTQANLVALAADISNGTNPVQGTTGDAAIPLVDEYGVTVVWDAYNEINFVAIDNKLNQINTKTPALVGGAVPVTGPLTDAQLRASAVPVSLASSPLPTGAATEATLLDVRTSVQILDNVVAVDGGAAPAQFQAVGGHTGTTAHAWHVDAAGLGRVDVRASVLPTGAATEAKQDAEAVLIGSLTETPPATDTASSGLNGRLQRIAQRISSLIALLPVSIGQKTMAGSLAVVVASDQSSIPVAQSALAVTYQEDLTVSTSAETFTAPAGAKSCLIQCPSTNTESIRVRLSGTATTTSGYLFEPGRSEYFPFAANISYIAVAGSGQAINVHFGT